MGPFTESMTRLGSEIVAQRRQRQAFVLNLGRQVDAMLAKFAENRGRRARQAEADRQCFVKALGQEVASLRARCRQAHQALARRTRAEQRAAISRLRKGLTGWRRELVLDLAGAHQAWFGPGPAARRAQPPAASKVQTGAAPPGPVPAAKAKAGTLRPGAPTRAKREAARSGRRKS